MMLRNPLTLACVLTIALAGTRFASSQQPQTEPEEVPAGPALTPAVPEGQLLGAPMEGNDCACPEPACPHYNSPGVLEHYRQYKHLRYLKSYRGATAQYTHRWNYDHAQQLPWHGSYAHTSWGAPLALVTPPTAAFQTRWGWGVGQTTAVPIYHQFRRPYPGTSETRSEPWLRTPWWPSHTDQFGVYYVRGPW